MQEVTLLIASAAEMDSQRYKSAEVRALIEKSKAIMQDGEDNSINLILKIIH